MLRTFLQRTIQRGNLRVSIGGGQTRAYGDGTGTEVAVRLTPLAAIKLALNPDLKLAECFMDGDLLFEAGDMYALLELVAKNPLIWRREDRAIWRQGCAAWPRWFQVNTRGAARRNVARHYDLPFDLYRRFLDEDLQYSCAYYRATHDTLEQAQAAKKAHIAAKLALAAGHRVLDIGCGWGGLALTLGALGAEVHGVTLSREQLAVARRRAGQAGLDAQVSFELCDYRDIAGRFDRIVSVGMFEHVGRRNYQAFFDAVARLLNEDGVAVIHTIARSTGPSATQPFIAKYIFPGGHIPALSEMMPAVERAGLWATDIEILRLHYAETLRAWRGRFEAQRMEIAAQYGQRFCRMWEFYLVSSEAGFRWFGMMNIQLQLTRRVDALPITRDYMVGREDMLIQAAEAGRATEPARPAAA